MPIILFYSYKKSCTRDIKENADHTPCGAILPSSDIKYGHRLPLFRRWFLYCIYRASEQDRGWGLQAASLPLQPVPLPDNFPDVSLNIQSPSSLILTPAPNSHNNC